LRSVTVGKGNIDQDDLDASPSQAFQRIREVEYPFDAEWSRDFPGVREARLDMFSIGGVLFYQQNESLICTHRNLLHGVNVRTKNDGDDPTPYKKR
jgi:hypothetical protein